MSAPVRRLPTDDGPPVRILLCEDADELRGLLRHYVHRHPGLELAGEAADGDEGLRLARRAAPDVVLLDLGMPGPAPVPLVATLRGVLPDAGIVLFSGWSGERLGPYRRAVDLEIEKGTPPALVVDRAREVGLAARRARGPLH